MPGKPYVQQALGAVQSGAVAFRADAQELRHLAEVEMAHWQTRYTKAEQQLKLSSSMMAAQQNETNTDMLHKTITSATREMEEAKTKMQQAETVAEQRAQAAESAAKELEAYVAQLNRLLGRLA